MRIGIDGRTIIRNRAGVGTYAERIVRSLLAVDTTNDYFVFVFEPLPDLTSPRLHQVNIQKYNGGFSRRWWENVVLPQYLAENSINLYFSPGFTLPILPRFAGWAERIPLSERWKTVFNAGHRAKYVVTIHDLIAFALPDSFTPKMRVWQQFFISNATQAADHILVSSESTRRDLFRFCNVSQANVSTVYLSLDEHYTPVRNKKLLELVKHEYSLPEKFILYVGTVEPRKNIPAIARAYALLPAPLREQFLLVLAGARGWYADEIVSNIERLGMRGKILFLDYVASEHMPALYTLSTLFVFPSFYEGFGFPPLEAMACGVPVITSTVSSLPEVAGDAAIQVDPNDVTALAGHMERVLTDQKLRNSLKRKGLQQARQFSGERTARETLRIFEEVCRRQPVP